MTDAVNHYNMDSLLSLFYASDEQIGHLDFH